MKKIRCTFRFLLLVVSVFAIINPLLAQWVQTNGPYGGPIQCFAVRGSIIFVGTDGFGVFESANNGTSWTAASNGFTGDQVYSLAVSRSELFAGTSDGVYLSTNNGTSWTAVNTGLQNRYVNALAVSGSNIFAGGRWDGVFLSTDNGTSWTAVDSGLTDPGVFALAVSGTNLFAGACGGGVYLSTNNGTSWTAVSTGLPSAWVRALAVSGTNLFAGGPGVYLSTNNGTSWTEADSGLTDPGVFALAVSGTNLFAGTYGGGVYLSTNNGTSWTGPGSGLPQLSINSLAVSGSDIFAGTDGGVFLSTDNGTTWAAADSGMTAPNVSCLAVSGSDIFVGVESSGLFLSTNDGTSWTSVSSGLPTPFVMSCAVSPNGTGGTNFFAGTWGGGVYLSTNNGATWTAASTGLPSPWIYSLAVSGPNLFAGISGLKMGVYLSTNNGTSWTEADSGITNKTPRCFGVIGTNLFAGISSYDVSPGVYLSTNNGASWTAADSGITNNITMCFAVIGTNLFAGTWGGGVYLSTNNGTSWANVLPLTPVFSLVLHGTNLFAGTFGDGVFLSTDSGTSWTAINSGSMNKDVYALAADGSNLFAGTYGGGVWRWPLSAVASSSAINLTATGASPNPSGGTNFIGQNGRGGARQPLLSAKNKSSGRGAPAVLGHGEVLLNWTKDRHPKFTRYRIYADTLPCPLHQIDSTSGGITDTTRLINGLIMGQTYHFRVTAVDDSGHASNYSNEAVTAAGWFSQKPMLTAIPGNGQVLVEWSEDNNPDFMHYCLYGDTLPHPITLIDSAITGVNDTTRLIQGLTNGTAYYYRIATVDSLSFESDSSSDVPAMPDIFVYPLSIGWNMVAVPLTVRDCRRSVLFPFAASNAFCYEGTYVIKDTLANGIGYWIRLNGSQYVSMDGIVRALDTIGVLEGWNMIGSISTPVAAAQITSDPGGLVTSEFFGYMHRYVVSDTIQPGKGYWVKMSQGGKLILASSGGAARASNRIRIVPIEEQPPAAPDGQEVVNEIPTTYALQQNYPNPFNPTTTVSFAISHSSFVTLRVYDVLGREVATLVNGEQTAGYKSVTWDASNLPSGIYFYRLRAGTFGETKKLLLLR